MLNFFYVPQILKQTKEVLCSVIGLAILLQKLLGDLKEQLSISESCDCPECVAERAEDAANEKSMDELLTAFLRGELQ